MTEKEGISLGTMVGSALLLLFVVLPVMAVVGGLAIKFTLWIMFSLGLL